MGKHMFYLGPIAAGLVPGLVFTGAIFALGDNALGLLAAFALSTLVGAASYFGLVGRGVASAAGALEAAVEQGAARDYVEALAHAGPAQSLFSVAERLRAALKQREGALLADIEARAADAKRRKKEADVEAQGYIEAHEVFMKTFTAALTALAQGDLSVRLETPYSKDYEKLRHCFNESIDRLNVVFGATAHGIQGLKGAVGDIAGAMSDLSERTGRQAASVEEASATLRSIVGALSKTVEDARSATQAVATTRERAEAGAGVVARAIEAMRRIQNSAGEIENIISVIDEIAFQTNLLALNAGVEAARAGDSGKGFAVVASEVRALALRSAEAAKQIKALIAASSAQVKDGVELVGETGAALEAIVGLVANANNTVAAIAGGASEQKTMLAAVDEAVQDLDTLTQANAAMVERTDQAGRSVRADANEIAEAVARFRLRGAAATGRRAAA
jgi:methyl-accepting chemotaxis protein